MGLRVGEPHVVASGRLAGVKGSVSAADEVAEALGDDHRAFGVGVGEHGEELFAAPAPQRPSESSVRMPARIALAVLTSTMSPAL